MRRNRVFRIGLVLSGMALPALAVELEREKTLSDKPALKSVDCRALPRGKVGSIPSGR